jgi:subtilisin family serine protease
MAEQRREPDPRFTVEIGSEQFDPKGEAAKARRRANSDRKRLAAALNVPPEAIPGTDQELWIVQFAEDPDLETIIRFRDDYGLQLTSGLSSLTFIESMRRATADRLRRESQVRACIRYSSELKLARSSLAPAEEIAGDRLLKLGLVEDVSESLLWKLELLAFRPVGPATPYPGGFLLRVKTGDAGDPEALLLLNEVEWVEDVRGYFPTNASSTAVAQSGRAGGSAPTPIWDKGLHGEGQIIGVFDGDIPDMRHDFFRDPAVAAPGPSHRKVLAIRSKAGPADFHATRVCGCAAGDDTNAPGTHPDRGGAWAAKLVYTDVDPLPAAGTMDAELQASAALGATVHTMSQLEGLADPSKTPPYTADAAAYDRELWRNEYLLLAAAVANTTNCDPNSTGFGGAPGSAKNPITVAGTKDVPNQDTFHTGRPGTRDGRRKPDLVAVGDEVRSSTLTTPTDSAVFSSSCGTSYATPHVAAAAALVRQYFVEGWYPQGKKTAKDQVTPSGALLKAVLLNATVDLAKEPGYPSAREGWGRLQLDQTLHFDGDKLFLRVKDVPHVWGFDRGPPANGKTFKLRVPDNAKSMKITLVFNDPAGAVGAKDPVVNKLDLLLMEPMRSRWTGWEVGYFANDFTDQKVTRKRFLQTGTTTFPPDRTELKNNVRQVVVDSPVAGSWGLHVFCHQFDKANTPKEWRRGLKAQGYAWVARVDLS